MKKYELVVEEKEFVSDKGEKVKYNALSVVVAGQKFILQVRKEDKQLFNYLIKNSH